MPIRVISNAQHESQKKIQKNEFIWGAVLNRMKEISG